MYDKMFKFVKDYLENNEAETIKIGKFPLWKVLSKYKHLRRLITIL